MVVPRFVKQALNGDPIAVYGDAEQTRSFCHVADIVPALSLLLSCDAASGKVVNLGNPNEVSINAVAERVKDALGSLSPIVHIPYEEPYLEGFEDMRRRVPDISLARKLIGSEPGHNLDDIIFSVADRMQAQATVGP